MKTEKGLLMNLIEAIAYTVLHLESFASMQECGVYSDKEVEAAGIIAKHLRAKHPGAHNEIVRIQTARRNRTSALLFKGFEHELPEEVQVELYSKVVQPYTGG